MTSLEDGLLNARGIALDSNFSLTQNEPLPVAVLQYQRLEWSELNFATAAVDKSKVGLNRITLRNEQEILSALVEAFEGILSGFAVKSDELTVQLESNTHKQYSDCWMAAHGTGNSSSCLEQSQISFGTVGMRQLWKSGRGFQGLFTMQFRVVL
ncbi:hypothetical protein BJ741DRAFT_708359 [Chytriomyces cf. hyalinus JEL632]|nr:hypothetical protein BJ741DRAFT_708359 [Chytriomyces cf. hyalinus JEL632]